MKLSEILYKTAITEVYGSVTVVIKGITADSREVLPGWLFVALRGSVTDGHQFIKTAIDKGALAIVCEELPTDITGEVTYVSVKNSSIALGYIAANFFGNPSECMKVVGITGTNGKTTTATLLYNLFRSLGYSCGLISTIRNMVDDLEHEAILTTPDAIGLNRLFRTMYEKKVEYCFMEVSSHAAAQHRIAGIKFAGAVFTNITHDHLDYHRTFDHYLKSKKLFFDNLPGSAFALVNADDRNGKVMVQNTRASVFYYGLQSDVVFTCKVIENRIDGLMIRIQDKDVWFKLTGVFNAYNLLAVHSTAMLLGKKPDQVLLQLSKLNPAEGRFELITIEGITAIVDYAHTPDALKNVLQTINMMRTGNEQIITITGAGGNRDRTKRPLMAQTAVALSNLVILTSDNPRNEDPEAILQEMFVGVPAESRKKVLLIENRREAIRAASRFAKKGDIILVAGKGHEKYQEIKGVKFPFDDRLVLTEILNQQSQPPK